MSLLIINNLSVTNSTGANLVENLSLSLGKGERLGLIGESGSGKSLTALATIGLLPDGLSTSGTITFPSNDSSKIRGHVVSVVFQEPLTALDPLMKIGKQLDIPLKKFQGLSGSSLESARLEALEEVRIRDPKRILNSYPYQISGGERQRAAIAIALACKPQLLIADEPTTALDVSVQAEVLDLLDEVTRRRNMALLFISHDLAVVSRITEKVIVLENGCAVESGSLKEIIAKPSHPYTQELIASARELDSALDIGGGARG